MDNQLTPNFRKAKFNKICESFSDYNWVELFHGLSCCASWELLLRKISQLQFKFIPLQKKNNLENPKWWNNSVKRALDHKKFKFIVYKRNPSDSNHKKYVFQRNIVSRLIRDAKRNYENIIALNSNSNPKLFYSYIKSKKVTSNDIGPLIRQDGILTSNSLEVAELLNTYFSSVFTNESNLSNSNHFATINIEPLVNIQLTEADVQNAINRLKRNKSPGPDHIYSRTIKELNELLCTPLKILFAMSFEQSTIPDIWKAANVTPIFKSGCKSKTENYRPISLTSLIGKLFESIIRDKIVNYLETNSLINYSQFGFRLKRSCVTNLLDFFDEVTKEYDQHKSVDIIYLDFQKAFDKVPHKRLMHKLHSIGIRGKLYEWIKEWLRNRKQSVVVNGHKSTWISVTSGVPQGSVLGPILFLIYINDIDNGMSAYISKFADDTKLMIPAISTINCDNLQSDLDKLNRWSAMWLMKFNENKCKVLHIGKNNPRYSYVLNDVPLREIESETDLGVTTTSDFKVGAQCSKASKRANKILGLIGRSFEQRSAKVIITLYKSLVRPHLEYCVQAWSPHYIKDIIMLERIQKRATRLIPGIKYLPYEERLRKLNLHSLSRRRTRSDLIEVYKMINGLSNIDINRHLSFSTSATRGNSLKINKLNVKTDIRKHSFFNRIIGLWNALPCDIVTLSTLPKFKHSLDNYMNEHDLESFYA